MRKKRYGLIGHPITHTMSGFIHERLFSLSNTDATYTIFDVKPKELSDKVISLMELDGYNVTMPHKHSIIQYMDKLERKAKLYKSVNTVLNDKLIYGFSTDAEGFLKSLEANNLDLQGRVVIIGAGSVARTIGFECIIKGTSTCLAVRPKDLLKAAKLSGEIRNKFSNWNMQTSLIDRIEGPIDILINATPVGLYPNIDEIPISEKVIKQSKCVFDVVYNPVETKMQKIAKANGAITINGLMMLVSQAALSHKIWYGHSFCDDELKQLYEDTKAEQNKLFPNNYE